MIEIYKALSEESRLRIIWLLMQQQEMCVCQIETYLKMTQSNASRHLTILKRCSILDSRKSAQWTHYLISDDFKENHKELFDYLKRTLVELPTYQKDHDQYEQYKNIEICNYVTKVH